MRVALRAVALFFIRSCRMSAGEGDQQRLQRHLQAALAAHKGGALEDAFSHYRAVLAINDALPAVHNNCAAVALALGQPAAAEASWRSALAHKADYAEAHLNLAVLLSERGDAAGDGAGTRLALLGEAKRHCELALEHRPGYVQGHHLMGNILASLSRPDEASTHYARAHQLAGGGAGGPAAAAAAVVGGEVVGGGGAAAGVGGGGPAG